MTPCSESSFAPARSGGRAWLLLLLSLVGPAVVESTAQPRAKDLDVLRERLVAHLVQTIPQELDAREAAEQFRKMRPDGSWSDVNYRDAGSLEAWKAAKHLTRVRDLTLTWHRMDPVAEADARKRLVPGITAALRYWFTAEPRSSSWWWNEIGVPALLGETLLLLDQENASRHLAKALPILQRGAKREATGANLLSFVQIQLVRGVLNRDAKDVDLGFQRLSQAILGAGGGGGALQKLSQELRGAAGGIQADLSFHQPGNVLDSGGFGQVYAQDVSRFAALPRGTKFGLSPEALDQLSRFILDGQQWMVRGGVFDPSAGGDLLRDGRNTQRLVEACRSLESLGTARQQEFRRFADRMEGKIPPADGAPQGNRHFWRSDLMVHHRPGYFASVRLASDRIDCADPQALKKATTQELLKCDGVTHVFRTGHEHDDVFAGGDVQRLPGATLEGRKEPLTAKEAGTRGRSSFAGGASDGEIGVAGMEFVRGALRGRKAWFFFDKELVFLGAGLRSTGSQPVTTGVQQSLLRGEFVLADGSGVRRSSRAPLESPEAAWAHQDSIGYVFLQGAKVQAIGESRAGAPAPLDVFGLWIDHGTPTADQTYAYAVLPGASPEATAAFHKAPPVQVVSNVEGLQAVAHRELQVLQAAFHLPGSVAVAEDLQLTVDQPCLLVVRRNGPELKLTIADPRNRQGKAFVSVSFNRRLEGEGAVWEEKKARTVLKVALPATELAGQSSTHTLRVVP